MSSCQSKPVLKLDWCSHEAARYAVEHWHYSDVFPTGKNNYIGVWENGQFIGSVIFGLGASPSAGKPYGLGVFEICELVRVALTHHESPVSRIVSIALRMLRKKNPGLRLCVSFADPYHDHVGAIYQAGNWIYTGTGQSFEMYRLPDGKMVHERRFSGQGWNSPQPIPSGARKIKMPPKHRYLYPLDDAMRAQIAPLAKPYPKRAAIVQAVEHLLPAEDGVSQRPGRSNLDGLTL
jgi:hypothetical protein